MPLVPAKCSICGAILNVESQKERLNKNGETYIKLGSWKKARETYQQMVEKFPDDYCGWWRLINCYYGDIKIEADFLLHMQRMEALQKLVSENDFSRYQAIMDEKLYAAAQVNTEFDTEKRLAEAKKLCSEYESHQ